jgi:hypothetical protein
MAANPRAGRDEHDIEAVAARHHGLEDRAAADLGAAAEHRFDGDGALIDVGPADVEILIGEIAALAGDDERGEVGERQHRQTQRRRRRLRLRQHRRRNAEDGCRQRQFEHRA